MCCTRATGSSRWAGVPATEPRWRGRWWAREGSWQLSTSTRQPLAFARKNLERARYADIVLVLGDRGLGYAEHAPYHRICVTAACPAVPQPLVEQVTSHGRLIAPVLDRRRQRLTLLERTAEGIRTTIIANVLYVSLRGRHGVGSDPRE